MKKSIIIFGAIFIILLMVSNATAVPQSYGKTIVNNINNTNQRILLLEETLELNIEKVNDVLYNVQSKGLFENLLALIQFLIDLIGKIINFIKAVMQIGQLIITLINLVKALINVINQFIEWLQGLINPEVNLVIQ
ncbi:MAG: hypothetical protein BV457_02965 [Thermoplasmata archaeon M9B1D]|nr:MAG: hypothetical protein BV457_02965 [Thermoplasmata archaeon M9B1D]PNX51862.1 MAG: hypothetical protein BV456_01620 [Thermoplasmata archaeon M8B2D]